ncbi:hypothetical protein [Mycobacterium sp. Marseille-P9652]|uniref:hypothetical protein n=1 Tax=Mycobacterium sp. Marseille-P9652 TaxID=2654950 RepID=UPI0012E7DCAC|nr:hypothetical protein [Mycobacterium sp. Marseille-P9652]
MRLTRTTVAAIAAVAAVAAGCSNGKSPSGSTSSQPPSSSSVTSSQPMPPSSSAAPGGALDQSTCLNISFTKDNLMVAQKQDDARRFADTLEKYSPPEPVKAAIEHFVTTVGAQPTDPDLDVNRDQLTNWIKQICPMVNP